MDQFSNYIKATAAEMKQVKWPTRQQALFYTVLIIVICAITAMYAGALDYIFGQVINYIVNNF